MAIPIESEEILSKIGKIGEGSKIGIIGAAFEGYCIWDDFAHYKDPGDRIMCDAAGMFITALAVGFIGTLALPELVAGVAIVAVSVSISVWISNYED